MAEFDIRVITRNDFLTNWENSGSIIKKGELAIAFSSTGVPLELKIGVGNTWNNTPSGLVPFIPIVTTTGRDLDNPGGPRTTTWQIETLYEAMQEIFMPYVKPGISLSPAAFTEQEVGNSVTYTSQAFNAGLVNAQNILVEGGQKKIYIDGVARNLANQSAQSTNEAITKTFTSNRTTAGSDVVLTVMVKDSRDSSQISASATITYKLRSGYFLWKNSDPLFTFDQVSKTMISKKTDAEITAIIKSVTGNIGRVRASTITNGNNGGGKSFGTIFFNSELISPSDPSYATNGLYDLYVYNTVGNAVIYNPTAGAGNPLGVGSTTFQYTNGNATTNYFLTKTPDVSKILGEYDLNIS